MTDLENPRRPTPGDDARQDRPLDVELQPDPEMQEGPAGAGRIAIYAVAIVFLLGAVFFGLNSSPTTTATNPNPPATTADNSASPPPPVRDVTPNRQPGTTTGAAPAQPVQPPQSGPTGTQVDQNKSSDTK